MKSKELVRRIQELDPDGSIEVCVGNAAITGCTILPAYYDGALQIIETDDDDSPIRGRRARTGLKMDLFTMRLSDAFEFEDFVIEYADESDRQRYEKLDLEARRHDKEINFQVEADTFADWVFLKIQAVKPISLGWVERIKNAALAFYAQHRGPDKDGKAISERKWGWEKGSYADRLHDLWDETIHVDWDNYSRIIIEFKHVHLPDAQ